MKILLGLFILIAAIVMIKKIFGSGHTENEEDALNSWYESDFD